MKEQFVNLHNVMDARDRQMTITMVSDCVGFGNYSYFTEQFKKYYGMTPESIKILWGNRGYFPAWGFLVMPGSSFAMPVSGGLSYTWGFLGGSFVSADFPVPYQAADNAGDQGEGQRHGAGKDNAVKAEQAAQYKEKRQEKQPLIQQRDKGGVGRLSGGLQKGLAELIQAVEGPDDYGGKYKNLTICNHFRVIDKGGDDGVPGKKADDGEKAAESRREEGCIADDFPHAFEIARTVIIGDCGLQSHADAQIGRAHV